ncbi:hypothetical protein MIR68_008645 [Amoeboaphelidium protococcarum]|nr:hypothetical protein MIR68_008645 [Amoeboaphelidium protococcarum]
MSFDLQSRGGSNNSNNNNQKLPGGSGRSPLSGDQSVVKQLRELLYSINSNVSTLQRLLTQTNAHDKRENLVSSTQDQCKRFMEIVRQHQSTASATTASTDVDKLNRDFKRVLSEFQQIQKVMARQSKSALQKAVSHQRDLNSQRQQQSLPPEELDRLQEQEPLMSSPIGPGRELTTMTQSANQTALLDNEIKYTTELIQEREESIAHLEKSIVEVNEIFRDLGTLVVDQGVMVDNIESNIESSATRMGDAVVELNTAERHQKKARNRMCFLLIVAAIILAILIIVLVSKR